MIEKQGLIIVILILTVHGSGACPPQCNNGCTQTTANCQQSGLRDVPQNFQEGTIIIDLSGNQLTELSERTFSSLPSVESLRLSNNGISDVEDLAFKNIPMLMSLDLSSNPIISISSHAFQGLTKIRSITLSSNHLELLGDGLSNLTTLGSLYAPFNRITEIRENDLAGNKQLRMLDLSQNQIRRIHPNAFKDLETLRYLNLNNNPIQEVKGLKFSSNVLQSVDFSMCQLNSVPTQMPPSVRDFRLGNNHIKTLLDGDFEGMLNLKLLTLNDNELRNISYRSLKALNSLSVLWLNRNQLYYIPQGLPSSLQKLQLDYNQIYEVQETSFSQLTNLDTIALDMNQIKRIDGNALQNLQELKTFSAQSNQLTDINTGTFSDLLSLEQIQLSDNPIATIETRSFGNLPNLTTLLLSHVKEQQSGLPRDFFLAVSNVREINLMDSPPLAATFLQELQQSQIVLPGVRKMHLDFNNLNTLPGNLRNLMPNLEKLSLEGNSFHCDKEMIGLQRWLRHSPMLLDGAIVTCSSPENLKDQDINRIPEAEFVDVTTAIGSEIAAMSDNRGLSPSQNQRVPELSGIGSFGSVSSGNVAVPKNPSEGDNSPDSKANKKGKKRKGKRKGKKGKGKKKRSKGKRRGKRNHKGRKRQRRMRRLRRKVSGKRKCVTLPDGGLQCRGARGRKGKKNKNSVATQEPVPSTNA